MISFPTGDLSLVDVLDLLDHGIADRSSWSFERIECAGNPSGCAEILRWSDDGISVDTEPLRHTATGVQLIEGEVIGTSEGGDRWITVRAVDGSWWDVEADDDIERRLLEIVPGAHAPPTG